MRPLGNIAVKEIPAREGVMAVLRATLRWLEGPNVACENGGSTRRACLRGFLVFMIFLV